MPRLNNKVSLITGASRGIGLAIAKAFLREGALVILSDIDTDLGLHETKELGTKAQFYRLDVREEIDWENVTQKIISQYGKLDILVNNAGITGFENGLANHDPENVNLEDWRAVHATNLEGTLLGCKYAIRSMRKNRAGSIINISSRSGLVGIPRAAAYASSKAAIRNHTKTVALYCAEEGLNIRCNSIHPAAILTPMWEPMLGDEPKVRKQNMREFIKDCPMQRFGEPSEVASLAVLLASDEAAYMNGTELSIDGALLAGSAVSPASRT
jgi:NAD(P)-dependent dehydrogenase (short-subunit alcohol dehydrogenase family)